jgi:hypothetical protein
VLRPVESEVIPLDADVDRDVTWLVVVLMPVESEVIPLDAEVDSDVIPLDADVEREVIRLASVLRPVESDVIPLDADVDSDVTWLFVAASPVDRELIAVVPALFSVDTDPSSDWKQVLIEKASVG